MIQHLFLLSVIIAISTIGFVVVKLGADKATSISLHATKHKTAFLIVACGITTALILNVFYLFGWLIPRANISSVGAVFYVILLSFLFVTAWVPDIEGKLRTAHRLTAYGAVAAMPLVLASILLSVEVSVLTQVILEAAILIHLVMIYLLFFVPAAYRHFLTFQGIYLVAFFGALLSVTYL